VYVDWKHCVKCNRATKVPPAFRSCRGVEGRGVAAVGGAAGAAVWRVPVAAAGGRCGKSLLDVAALVRRVAQTAGLLWRRPVQQPVVRGRGRGKSAALGAAAARAGGVRRASPGRLHRLGRLRHQVGRAGAAPRHQRAPRPLQPLRQPVGRRAHLTAHSFSNSTSRLVLAFRGIQLTFLYKINVIRLK